MLMALRAAILVVIGSQAADLGNDRPDWATITDESQVDDLR
jgi:hypothetical protein